MKKVYNQVEGSGFDQAHRQIAIQVCSRPRNQVFQRVHTQAVIQVYTRVGWPVREQVLEQVYSVEDTT